MLPSTVILRRLVRRTVPLKVRQDAAQLRRLRRDRRTGLAFDRKRGGGDWPVAVSLSQPVMPSAVFQAKLANLRRGAALLHANIVEGGGDWSFWNRIGKPTARNGFAAGRNIVDGRLVLQVGGGLCQLSSLIYHLALLAGLEITERHHHSIDIYREEDRFTPLGADVTVVWGFKDLRLRNPYTFPISICCFPDGHRLWGEIRCRQTVIRRDVEFLREGVRPGLARVYTLVDGNRLWVTDYEQRQGMECG